MDYAKKDADGIVREDLLLTMSERLNAVTAKLEDLGLVLLKDADKLGDSRPYRFDIIDIQRQIMSNLVQAIHNQAAKAFKEKD